MGEHNVNQEFGDLKVRCYTKALLTDLCALEYMLDNDMFESGKPRIGAEQEMFFVNSNMRPAPVGKEVLTHAHDSRLTTEIAKFNIELNLTPQRWEGACLRKLEDELQQVVQLTRKAAHECGADVLLSGILPTLQPSDLSLANMTDSPRYFELNRALSSLREEKFSIHIKGLDELHHTHDNVMMESCNTSFQIHLQVSPKDFVPFYNIAQAVTAPVLAAAVNSPLLFGYRLWQETRLALFQHSTDNRSIAQHVRNLPPRVGFGEGWLKHSVLDLFREQVARFRTILVGDAKEDSMKVIAQGGVPSLSALCLHNGTIWPWNRACYGVTEGKAHLRIENRALPSGPSILDEMANTAFYLGLMAALPIEYGDITEMMSFDDAKSNFFAAARYGLGAQLTWLGGKTHSASNLILEHLLPLARHGLEHASIDPNDIDRLLGTVEERVVRGQTGAQWMLRSFAAISDKGTRDMAQRALAECILERQQTGEPVHRWPIMEKSTMGHAATWSRSYRTVGQFMSTDLFTVQPDDLIDMAANVMDWRHIRHVPVEDNDGIIVGLLSHRALLRRLAQRQLSDAIEPIAVRTIMKPDPVTVTPSTPTLEAIKLMRTNKVGCLPVVDGGRLVGIVTAQDFLDISAKLFEEQLSAEGLIADCVQSQPMTTESLVKQLGATGR